METIKKTTSFLEVLLFEPESDSITEALGITDERADELIEVLKSTLEDNRRTGGSTITDDIYRMSINVKHVNELSFLLFAYGKHVGSQTASMNSHIDPSKILDILKRFTPPDLSSDDDSTEDI
jgi:hypothetical protein